MSLTVALSKLIGRQIVPTNRLATVVSVDAAARTCTVAPLLGGPNVEGVRLIATLPGDGETPAPGLVVFPRVGTAVVYGVLENSVAEAFIVQQTEFESVLIEGQNGFKLEIKADGTATLDAKTVTINGGDNGGLVNVEGLVSRLNEVENHVRQMHTWASAHVHTSAAPASPTSPPTVAPTSTPPANTVRQQLEDANVKH